MFPSVLQVELLYHVYLEINKRGRVQTEHAHFQVFSPDQ